MMTRSTSSVWIFRHSRSSRCRIAIAGSSCAPAAAFTHPGGDRQVPFIHQPAIGGAQTLRGYSDARFRDQNALWASAEYQWEAWWALDGAFFVDAGQVAAERSDFNLTALDVTYGIGFRLHGNDNFIARLDLAYGREGFHPSSGVQIWLLRFVVRSVRYHPRRRVDRGDATRRAAF